MTQCLFIDIRDTMLIYFLFLDIQDPMLIYFLFLDIRDPMLISTSKVTATLMSIINSQATTQGFLVSGKNTLLSSNYL